MNHDHQNKNNCTEIMFEDEIIIDLDDLDLSNDQTWLVCSEADSGSNVDLRDWLNEDVSAFRNSADYVTTLKDLFSSIDKYIKRDISPERQKFDSRTYKKPNKRVSRPSLNTMVEALSPPIAARPHPHLRNMNQTFSASPILRLKTFNVDIDTENSTAVKEYAMKRRSLIQEDELLDDAELMSSSTTLGTSTSEAVFPPSKPINIDLSQPAHNLHRMSRFPVTISGDDGSLSLLKSGDSFMNMSPPSLVNSIVMETSGTFLPESMDSRKSLLAPRNSNNYVPHSGKESIDHNHQSMISSMSLSILDDKDMSTSFLSQTTCQDNDSLIGSLPPSMGSSVNSSFNIGVFPKNDSGNLLNSGTFSSLLESSERLLNGRPRYQPYKPFFKPQSQNYNNISDNQKENMDEPTKINDKTIDINSTKKYSSDSPNLNDSIDNTMLNRNKTLNVSQRENVNATFKKENSPLFRNTNMYNTYKKEDFTHTNDFISGEHERGLNVTVDKTELNEIIQAKAKLSLARNTLPNLPNQAVDSKNLVNVSELLGRKRGDETLQPQKARESPKRNATFKKESPSKNMDTTIIYVKQQVQAEDDNNTDCDTIVLGDADDFENKKDESCERTMVGSNESMEEGAGTSSASRASVSRDSSLEGENSRANSPNMDVHQRNADMQEKRLHQVNSTPLGPVKKGLMVADLLNIQNTISPITDPYQPESRRNSISRISPSNNAALMKRSPIANNAASPNRFGRNITAETKSPGSPINTATIIRKPNSRKELLPSPNRTLVGDAKKSPNVSPSAMPPPSIPRKTGLPTSKLRQYSSHKELSRIPGGPLRPSALTTVSGLRMGERRGVYASNPALSPTARAPSPPPAAPLLRRDSYTIAAPTLLNTQNTEGTRPPAVVKRQTSGKLSTDTFRRPQSQLITPKDIRYSSSEISGPQGTALLRSKTHIAPSQTGRPNSVSGASQLKPRASSVVPTSASAVKNLHPATSAVMEATERLRAVAPLGNMGTSSAGAGAPSSADYNKRASSALPRPSRLPAPRSRSLRPPSVYSLAPSADQASDHY